MTSPRRDAWGMVAVLSIAAIVAYIDRLILSVLFVPLTQDLALSDTQASLVQGASFAIIYAVAGVPLGIAADRWNRRLIVIAGVVIWCGATIACGFASSFAELAAARILVGVGEAALVPAATSMIGDGVRLERRGLALSIFVMGQVIGGALAVTAGGVLFDLAQSGSFDAGLSALNLTGTPSWRVVLWLVGLMGVPLVLALLCLREPQRSERGLGDAHGVRGVFAQFVARRDVLLPLYLTLACAAISDFSIGSWTPTLLVREFEWSASRIGVWFGGCLFASGVIAAAVSGWLTDRASNKGVPGGALRWAFLSAVIALVTASYAAVPDPYWLLAILLVQSTASSICSIICVITIQLRLPNELRGVGSSFTSLGNMLFGLGMGPTLVALATDRLYRDHAALDISIITVVAPAFAIATAFLFAHLRTSQPTRTARRSPAE
jgi:MFS family permease